MWRSGQRWLLATYSLVPRPSHRPVFDRASNQKLDGGKVWLGYIYLIYVGLPFNRDVIVLQYTQSHMPRSHPARMRTESGHEITP